MYKRQVQCLSLVPGVSRSGATISAGLWRGIDRVTATRLSFFLAIPALTAAGVFEAATTELSGLGFGQMALGVLVAFGVAYASIAWLLRFVAGNRLTAFVLYRVVLGVVIVAASMGAINTPISPCGSSFITRPTKTRSCGLMPVKGLKKGTTDRSGQYTRATSGGMPKTKGMVSAKRAATRPTLW